MSIYSKYKGADYIDSGKSPRLNKKKYAPSHMAIQKKQHRFNQDWYWMDTGDGKFVEMGIQKESIKVDDPDYYDWAKDGN